jgi:hypothetical protein
MYKNATKCNKTLSKWCKNKHGASTIIDTFETYQGGKKRMNYFMRFMGMQAEKVFIEKDKVTAEKDKSALEVQRVATEARRSGKRGKSIRSCMLHKTVNDLVGQHNPHGSEDEVLV